jgi:hypothetical protein
VSMPFTTSLQWPPDVAFEQSLALRILSHFIQGMCDQQGAESRLRKAGRELLRLCWGLGTEAWEGTEGQGVAGRS